MRTYSRGAMVCLPFGCMITTLLSLRYQFHMRKIQILLPIFLLCFFGALLLLPNIIKRFENAPKESLMTRQYLAASAWNMMKDKPFAGVGLNNWGIKINPPYDYSRHRDPKKGYTEDYKDGIVETIYLLVGAECGIPCLLILLLWFAFYWFSCIRLMIRFRHTRWFYLPVGVFGGLTGAFMQSTLEWILKQQINFMWMIILFAMISYLNRYSRELVKQENNPTQLQTQTT